MASDCCSLVFIGFCLLSFSCGVRGRELHLIDKEVGDSGHVAPMLYPNFNPYFSKAKNSETSSEIASLNSVGHQRAVFALTFVQDSGPFVGGGGDIVVWHPNVATTDLSTNFVGCVANDVSISVGYGVFPTYSGDTKSRIFVSTTIEGETCFNDAKCMNFVPVDSIYSLGGTLNVSVYNDPTNRQVLRVSIDKEEEKWWVSFNKERIGYFNSDIMIHMECRAILWGGSVVWGEQKATTTQMGNGRFPKDVDPMHCGSISRAYAINKDGITDEKPYRYIVDNPNCYDIAQTSASDFQYGGSGALSRGCN